MASDASIGVRLYTRRWCGYCFAARQLFTQLGVDFEEIAIDGQSGLRQKVSERAGNWRTVPMVFIGDHFIGGYQEAAELLRRGELKQMCFPD